MVYKLSTNFDNKFSLYSKQNTKDRLASDFKTLSEVEGGKSNEAFEKWSKSMNELKDDFKYLGEAREEKQLFDCKDKDAIKKRKFFLAKYIIPTLLDPSDLNENENVDITSKTSNNTSKDNWKKFNNLEEFSKYRELLYKTAENERNYIVQNSKSNKKKSRDNYDGDDDTRKYARAAAIMVIESINRKYEKEVDEEHSSFLKSDSYITENSLDKLENICLGITNEEPSKTEQNQSSEASNKESEKSGSGPSGSESSSSESSGSESSESKSSSSESSESKSSSSGSSGSKSSTSETNLNKPSGNPQPESSGDEKYPHIINFLELNKDLLVELLVKYNDIDHPIEDYEQKNDDYYDDDNNDDDISHLKKIKKVGLEYLIDAATQDLIEYEHAYNIEREIVKKSKKDEEKSKDTSNVNKAEKSVSNDKPSESKEESSESGSSSGSGESSSESKSGSSESQSESNDKNKKKSKFSLFGLFSKKKQESLEESSGSGSSSESGESSSESKSGSSESQSESNDKNKKKSKLFGLFSKKKKKESAEGSGSSGSSSDTEKSSKSASTDNQSSTTLENKEYPQEIKFLSNLIKYAYNQLHGIKIEEKNKEDEKPKENESKENNNDVEVDISDETINYYDPYYYISNFSENGDKKQKCDKLEKYYKSRAKLIACYYNLSNIDINSVAHKIINSKTKELRINGLNENDLETKKNDIQREIGEITENIKSIKEIKKNENKTTNILFSIFNFSKKDKNKNVENDDTMSNNDEKLTNLQGEKAKLEQSLQDMKKNKEDFEKKSKELKNTLNEHNKLQSIQQEYKKNNFGGLNKNLSNHINFILKKLHIELRIAELPIRFTAKKSKENAKKNNKPIAETIAEGVSSCNLDLYSGHFDNLVSKIKKNEIKKDKNEIDFWKDENEFDKLPFKQNKDNEISNKDIGDSKILEQDIDKFPKSISELYRDDDHKRLDIYHPSSELCRQIVNRKEFNEKDLEEILSNEEDLTTDKFLSKQYDLSTNISALSWKMEGANTEEEKRKIELELEKNKKESENYNEKSMEHSYDTIQNSTNSFFYSNIINFDENCQKVKLNIANSKEVLKKIDDLMNVYDVKDPEQNKQKNEILKYYDSQLLTLNRMDKDIPKSLNSLKKIRSEYNDKISEIRKKPRQDFKFEDGKKLRGVKEEITKISREYVKKMKVEKQNYEKQNLKINEEINKINENFKKKLQVFYNAFNEIVKKKMQEQNNKINEQKIKNEQDEKLNKNIEYLKKLNAGEHTNIINEENKNKNKNEEYEQMIQRILNAILNAFSQQAQK